MRRSSAPALPLAESKQPHGTPDFAHTLKSQADRNATRPFVTPEYDDHREADTERPPRYSGGLTQKTSRSIEPPGDSEGRFVSSAPVRRFTDRSSIRTSAAPRSADFPRGTAAALGMAGAVSERTGARLPFVLVATRDVNLVRKLSAWLDPRAAVLRVRNVLGLVQELENAAGARTAIVIDCLDPSVRPVAVAALASEFPPHTRVILWGATAELENSLRMFEPSADSWTSITAEARPKELAERCVELVTG